MMSLETLLIIVAFVFGCVWGSFFNVAIYRLPREMSVVKPASHCFACNAPVAWYDNIPLVSWLILRGRCRHCGAPFSFRYFVVELLSGLLFMFVMMKYIQVVTAKGSVVPGVIAILLHWCLIGGFIVLTFIDFDHKIIPDGVSLPGIVLGLLASFAVPTLVARFPVNGPDVSHWWGLIQGAIGAAVGGGLMLFIAVAGKAVFKKEAMGGGDLKLMAMIGAYMGWQLVLLVLFFSAFVGTIVGVSLIVARRAAWSSQIPFGPYIVLGALLAFFFGPDLIQWYLGLFHSPETIPPIQGTVSVLLQTARF